MKKSTDNYQITLMLYCGGRDGVIFSKVVDQSLDCNLDSGVGQTLDLEILPGRIWSVKIFNKFDELSGGAPPVLFVESYDQALFLCLCDSGYEEGGWEEVMASRFL
ncbi:MAG TPA: hypothetical protein VMR73_02385 [Candidatus Paceibacterota bacterium]|nr:hypothetical protein [Candidatus Paceibacterota bacterium]